MSAPFAAAAGRPLARLAVTIAAPILASLAGRVPLPGVDRGVAFAPEVGVLTLGLEPFVSAFVLVELAAVAWPAWRALRVGRAGRARLETAAIALGLLLAVAQAWGVTAYLASIGGLPATLAARAVGTLTLVAGSGALAWVATAVGRHGLGNGYAVLFASWGLTLPGERLPDLRRALVGTAELGAAGGALLGLVVALHAIVAILALRLLLANDRAPESDPPALRLRDPASGLVPLPIVGSVLLAPGTLSGFPGLAPLAEALQPGSVLRYGVELALAVALGLVLARLFSPPGRVAEVWGRLDAAPVEHARLEERARGALRVGRMRVVAVLALFVLAPAVPAALGFPVLLGVGSLGLAHAFAAVADVLGEWRARSGAPDLVSVWPEHRLYAVDAGRAALSAAGFPFFTRGVHYRTLGQFFAPYVPVEFLVPASCAGEAEAILRRVLAGEGGAA